MNVKRVVVAAAVAAGFAMGAAVPAFAADENVPPADSSVAPVSTQQCSDGAGQADFDGNGTRYCAGGEYDGAPISPTGADPAQPGAQPAPAPGLPGLSGVPALPGLGH